MAVVATVITVVPCTALQVLRVQASGVAATGMQACMLQILVIIRLLCVDIHGLPALL
jgi:hypothetical protein